MLKAPLYTLYSVACHCEIFLNGSFPVINPLFILPAKIFFFSNKNGSRYLSVMKDYSKLSW